jgi:hypothetical protein
MSVCERESVCVYVCECVCERVCVCACVCTLTSSLSPGHGKSDDKGHVYKDRKKDDSRYFLNIRNSNKMIRLL